MKSQTVINKIKKLYTDNDRELSCTGYIMAARRLEHFLSCISIMKKERLKNGDPLPIIPERLEFEPFEIR